MVYTMPPQTDNGANAAFRIQVLQDASEAGTDAAPVVEGLLSNEEMMDSIRDGQGRITKMHFRDDEGHVKTIRFDFNRHEVHQEDGNC